MRNLYELTPSPLLLALVATAVSYGKITAAPFCGGPAEVLYMVYILDPERRIYAFDVKSKAAAIGAAIRKYDPLRPFVRASVMRDAWIQMQREGYCLKEVMQQPSPSS
jgi:hypothetical protein